MLYMSFILLLLTMYENRVKKYEMKIWSKRDIEEKYFDTLIRFWILIKFPPNKYIFFLSFC